MCIAPGDYTSATEQYTFMPGDTRLDIPVTIVDDSTSESAEQYLGRLSTTSANAVIDVPYTTVTINDNDRKINWLKYSKPIVFAVRIIVYIIIIITIQ